MEKLTCSCKYCGKPTVMISTEMCDNCWEVDRRIDDFVKTHSGRIRVEQALLLEKQRKMKKCTGLTAMWCPNHGNCTCPMHGNDPNEVTMDDDECPLHSRYSTHAEG